MEQIINIGILAHVDAGKTTLTEHMLYHTGAIRRAGSVDTGTAVTDSLEVERRRGISVRSACVSVELGDKRINIIDTPGHVDFSGEVERALSVLDAAVLMIAAPDGITEHTRRLWKAVQTLKLPTIIAVNKIDHPGCDIDALLAELRKEFGANVAIAASYDNLGDISCVVSDMGEDGIDEMMAVAAEYDGEVQARFLSDTPMSETFIKNAFRRCVERCETNPLIPVCAAKGEGVKQLLDAICAYLPFHNLKAEDAPVAGVIYKVEHHPTMGKACHIRLYSGTLKNRDSVQIAGQDEVYKITQIRRVFSGKSTDIGELFAGDIGAVYGLSGAKTGDLIGDVPFYKDFKLTSPLFSIRLIPKEDKQMTDLVAAVSELADEDPLLKMVWLKEERELQVQITGMMQKEILAILLKDRYGLEPEFSAASVIYKETPTTAGIGFDAYTMPKPCWAIIKFEITPLPRGSGFVYEADVAPRDCAYRYQEHIKVCLPRYLHQGLHGWEVTDLKVKLIYAQHHHIHTHPLDFFLATPLAFLDGLRNTGTTLLEPMLAIKITAQEDILGKVIGDILDMRGTFDTPQMKDGKFILTGKLPAATSMEYPIHLGSISGGKALYEAEFAGYEECPLELGKEVPYRGVCPLDRAKWILYCRSALNPNEV